ncbi:MAG: P-type DNA transfer ATPase VirB11 [Comamonadaceae bacterium]|nr:MAG: P-type DNA transfer ATPase VirB11 [Comamonadaceae bacterium]
MVRALCRCRLFLTLRGCQAGGDCAGRCPRFGPRAWQRVWQQLRRHLQHRCTRTLVPAGQHGQHDQVDRRGDAAAGQPGQAQPLQEPGRSHQDLCGTRCGLLDRVRAAAGGVAQLKVVVVGVADKYLSIQAHLQVFEGWLADAAVNEVAVNAPGIVQLWKGGVWEQVAAPAVTYGYLQALGNYLANISKKPFDEGDPILSAHLPGGERIELTMPPTAARGMIYLNLRKHTSQSFVLKQFIEQDYFVHTRHVHAVSLSTDARDRLLTQLAPTQRALWDLAQEGDWPTFLTQAVQGQQNLIALIELIPQWERLITVEDTPEMPLHSHANSQALFYRRDAHAGERVVGATAKQVLQAVMRKTPNRVLLAELRGDETFYYVQNVLNSGHPGGITTVHANSPTEAFMRIALLIKASDEGRSLALNEILRLLHTLVHVVVQLVFDRERGRHVPAIYYDPMQALAVAQ